jgi:hypothetical protein
VVVVVVVVVVADEAAFAILSKQTVGTFHCNFRILES